MARFKPYDYSQMKFIPVSFKEQILPGTFEYTLNQLIDEDIDLSVFEARYRNDETGAPAYDPAILLKIILYAYSRGITSSRQIERLCRENVVFIRKGARLGIIGDSFCQNSTENAAGALSRAGALEAS